MAPPPGVQLGLTLLKHDIYFVEHLLILYVDKNEMQYQDPKLSVFSGISIFDESCKPQSEKVILCVYLTLHLIISLILSLSHEIL